jgi:hypothetical protein
MATHRIEPPEDVQSLAARLGAEPRYHPATEGSNGYWSVGFGATGVAKVGELLQGDAVARSARAEIFARDAERPARDYEDLLAGRLGRQAAREFAHERRWWPAGERRRQQAIREAHVSACERRRRKQRPSPPVRPRTRQPRPSSARRSGSRRTTARARSPDDPPGDPEPPGLKLWWHPRWGRVTPNLLRLLRGSGR